MHGKTMRFAAILAAAFLGNTPGRTVAEPLGQTDRTEFPTRPRLAPAAPGKLAIAFEENRGQVDPAVRFLSRGKAATLFLTADQAVLALAPGGPGQPGAALRMALVGAAADPCMTETEDLPGRVSYLRGSDSRRWIQSAPTYAGVRYEEVYPGIDLVFHGSEGRLEYDFVVKPGADPAAIRLRFEGAEKLALDPAGDLVLSAGGREVVHHAPLTYQRTDTGQVAVASNHVLEGDEVRFEVGEFDRSRELVIDPVLGFSTYLGGSSHDVIQDAGGIAVDSAGNIYVTGWTLSVNFPATAGAFDPTYNGDREGFVAKLSPSGSTLIYSTYLGGSGLDTATDIAVDSAGNAYVSGATRSADFPTTAGAFDTTFNGGGSGDDGFLAKLDPSGGALVYSTFLGGATSDDAVGGITVDAAGSVFAVGNTLSTDFPTTAGAFDRSYNGDRDAFVTKLNAAGSALVYSTYLGGPPPKRSSSGLERSTGVAVNASGNAFVIGYTNSDKFPTTAGAYDRTLNGKTDAFVTKLNPGGSALVYSTYLGGTGTGDFDEIGMQIAVDPAGAAFAVGATYSSDFPTTVGAYDRSFNGTSDIFATKLNAAGSALVYSTFVGGSGSEIAAGVSLDTSGAAYLSGETSSTNFPTTADALDTTLGGAKDIVVCKLNPAGSQIIYSSYFGGTLSEESSRCETSGNSLYLAGTTQSLDLPIAGEAYQGTYQGGVYDACVFRLDF